MNSHFDTIVCFKTFTEDIDPVTSDMSRIQRASNGRYTLNSEMSFYLDMPEIANLVGAKVHNVYVDDSLNIFEEYEKHLKRLGKILFVVEPWVLHNGHFQLLDLKRCDEGCEIVVLAWDDYYYLSNIFPNDFCIENIELANLYLTNDPRSVCLLREKLGVNAHFYISTPCKKMIEITEYIQQTLDMDPVEATGHDIGCFMTFKNQNEYRCELKRYLNKTFDNILIGDSNTVRVASKNISQTVQDYLKIKVHLGNTSSAWAERSEINSESAYLKYLHDCSTPECTSARCSSTEVLLPDHFRKHRAKTKLSRCMKGVKDFIAPLANAVLIYDDFHWNKVFYQDVFPLYEYNNFETIKETYDEVTKDKETTSQILAKQKDWIKKHSFFNQFKYILENDRGIFDEALLTSEVEYS
tara:strand:- start:154 stop:1386 length:1233 start_codon:yes stop_codon:yes gene_type:complete